MEEDDDVPQSAPEERPIPNPTDQPSDMEDREEYRRMLAQRLPGADGAELMPLQDAAVDVPDDLRDEVLRIIGDVMMLKVKNPKSTESLVADVLAIVRGTCTNERLKAALPTTWGVLLSTFAKLTGMLMPRLAYHLCPECYFPFR